MDMPLPQYYDRLTTGQRKKLREDYMAAQGGMCMWCKASLAGKPTKEILDHRIDWRYFPPGFRKHPVHLQHDRKSGLTEGAVHAYCNAVMWQYHRR